MEAPPGKDSSSDSTGEAQRPQKSGSKKKGKEVEEGKHIPHEAGLRSGDWRAVQGEFAGPHTWENLRITHGPKWESWVRGRTQVSGEKNGKNLFLFFFFPKPSSLLMCFEDTGTEMRLWSMLPSVLVCTRFYLSSQSISGRYGVWF